MPPIMGAKTIAVMTSAGRLRVDDPWAMDMVASMLAPLLLNAAETGTMQAEQRVMAGPTIRPLRAPLSPPAANSLPLKPGKDEGLDGAGDEEGEGHAGGYEPQVGEGEAPPAFQEGGVVGRSLCRSPGSTSTCGPVAASRSSCTSPSLGMRLKTTKRTSRAASSRRPDCALLLEGGVEDSSGVGGQPAQAAPCRRCGFVGGGAHAGRAHVSRPAWTSGAAG